MDGFEFFGGMDNADSFDAAAFEKFKERIKAASAQIKALKKAEKKKKEKEDQLIQILLQFVKTSKKQDIMLLIARLLELNIPTVFVLSIVLLGNKDIQEKAGIALLTGQNRQVVGENRALSFFDRGSVLPLEIKIEIDAWMKNMLTQALEYPHRMVETVYDEDGNLVLPLLQLTSFVLRDFLNDYQQEFNYEKLKEFSDFFINGIMKNVLEHIENQKELNEGENNA